MTHSAEVFQQEPFKRSPITQQLVEIIKSVPEGETINYETFSEEIHGDVRKYPYSYHLKNARNIALRDYGIVLKTIPTVGFYRLKNHEIAKTAHQEHHQKFVNDTKRFREKLEVVDDSVLEGGAKHEYLGATAYLALREATASTKVQKAISKAASEDPIKVLQQNEEAIVQQLKGLWKK